MGFLADVRFGWGIRVDLQPRVSFGFRGRSQPPKTAESGPPVRFCCFDLGRQRALRQNDSAAAATAATRTLVGGPQPTAAAG